VIEVNTSDNIKNILENFNNINFDEQNYENFISQLKLIDLNTLAPELQQKAKIILSNTKEQNINKPILSNQYNDSIKPSFNKETLQTVTKLLQKGMDVVSISEMTGLPLAEVKKIEDQELLKNNCNTGMIYIIIFLVSIFLGILIRKIGFITFTVALITIVTGKMKCPNNKVIKVLFWLFLINVVLIIIATIIITFVMASTFINACQSME